MSDFIITGNANPVVGKEEFYSIEDPLTSLFLKTSEAKSPFDEPVLWTVHVLEYGRWRKTKENDKVGDKVSYTFLQRSLDREGIRILARKGDQIARLDIKTQFADKPKINNIELLDKSGKKPDSPLSYGQTIKTRVHCLHMERREVFVTLWEDDAKGTGENEKNIIETRSGIVKEGIVEIDFLLKPSYAKIFEGSASKDRKQHHYYVSTNFDLNKLESIRLRVNDLNETPVKDFKGKTSLPSPKQNDLKIQPSDASTTTKSEITKVHITDIADRVIKGIFKEKQIKVWVESKELIGKEVRLKLYDHDSGSPNDLLADIKFAIKSNVHAMVIPLNKISRSLGGNFFQEGAEQELFAHVEVLQSNKSLVSEIVQVDAKVFKQDEREIVNAVMKVFTPEQKEEKEKEKGACVCKENNFYWSDKLTCAERKKVLEVCANIWGENIKKEKASELMSIIHLETGNETPFKPYADNGKGFSGLIQFSDVAAKQLGTTRTNLKKMTFIDQMVYVENYFIKKKSQLHTMTDLYLMVLKPNAVGKGNNPDFILFDESISVPDGDGRNTSKDQRMININQEPWVTKYGYASNPPFMKGNEHTKRKKWVYTRQQYEQRWGFENGNTTVGEVAQELKVNHYDKGASHLFKGICDDIVEENESGKGIRAPWMDIAIDVAKEMKGCIEEKDPMYTNAKKYLKYCGNTYEPTDGDNGPWCAAFMNWSIGQTKNIETKLPYTHAKSAASLAPIDKDLGVRYKKIDKPIYGCIVVYKHITQWKGHTGFLFGKTKGGEYILIGGNQDDTIRFDSYGEYTSKSKKKKIYGFYIPKDYEITSEDDITDKDIYTDAEVLNKKYGIVSKKASGKTN